MISLIHPSRGRAQKSFDTTSKWIARACCEVELIISLDESDLEKNRYKSLYNNSDTKIIINDNDCVVKAANHAAKESKGDILVYVSDDFDCPNNWGTQILDIVIDYPKEWLLKVDDCLQRFEADVLTIPIMSRGLYEYLGYFFHPSYRSMFCDQDLYWTVNHLGAMKFSPNLKFPHEHYCNKKSVFDLTYEQSNKNWDSGKELYTQRKKMNFPR